MLLGALLDAGLELDTLRSGLSRLAADGYQLDAQPGARGAVQGIQLSVNLDEEGRRRRDWSEFLTLIEKCDLSNAVKSRATGVFKALMDGEAKAHRTGDAHHRPHELATVDTLVDVVGVIYGLEQLGVDRIHCSAFPAGKGTVKTQHGVLPVPALATIEIFATANAPLRTMGPDFPDGETVTPTGAALLTQIASFEPTVMNIERVGYGLGGRDTPGHPNVIALWLGSANESGVAQDTGTGLVLLETNIDDMSGELFGYVQERLFESGARDVWMTPIQMKKNRPGVLLSALVDKSAANEATQLILRETSTLGVRVRDVERVLADREELAIATTLGDVRVKVKRLSGVVLDVSPEYEACKDIARREGLPLQDVMRQVREEARKELG